MILDHISNHALLTPLHPRFKQAFDFIKQNDLNALESGRHDIDGDNLFVVINRYQTLSPIDAILESHRDYIDIQYIIDGTEQMGHVLLDGQESETGYLKERDFIGYPIASLLDSLSFFNVKSGQMAIFWPHDIHMPGAHNASGQASDIVKAVFKVKID